MRLVSVDKVKAVRRNVALIMMMGLLVAGLAGHRPAHAQAEGQDTFATPQEAVNALMNALGNKDPARMVEIFGPGSEDILFTGVKGVDRRRWKSFMDSAKEMSRIVEQEDGRATLYIGKSQWPFPIALAKAGDRWFFDTEDGREEILIRRIGANELKVIEGARAYRDAQRLYESEDRNGDGVLEYATKIVSDEGQRNGLYFPVEAGEDLSALGPGLARASAQGYRYDEIEGRADPFNGYYYKILTRQGPNAPGGAYDYIINGHMVAGFGLVAYPADYGSTGIMTFMVNQHGDVFENDLGEDTGKLASEIDSFDPDESWTRVEEGD